MFFCFKFTLHDIKPHLRLQFCNYGFVKTGNLKSFCLFVFNVTNFTYINQSIGFEFNIV